MFLGTFVITCSFFLWNSIFEWHERTGGVVVGGRGISWHAPCLKKRPHFVMDISLYISRTVPKRSIGWTLHTQSWIIGLKVGCWSQKSRILGIFIVRAIRIYLTRVPFKCWQPFQISHCQWEVRFPKLEPLWAFKRAAWKELDASRTPKRQHMFCVDYKCIGCWLEYPLKWGLNWGVPLIWVWKKNYFLFFDHPFKLDSLCYLSPMMTHQEQMPKVMYTILLGGHK